MPQSFACLPIHLVFSTKNREPLIHPTMADRLHGYIGGVLRGDGNVLMLAGGMPDHVHLLVSLSRQSAVADVVRGIKSVSSGWVHSTYSKLAGFAWQAGYGAFAVSYSNIEGVTRYIRTQAEHHRVRSFKEEYRAFLDRHGIEYDERYVWD